MRTLRPFPLVARLAAVLATIGLLCSPFSQAHAFAFPEYTVTTLDPGGGISVTATGINDNGTIIGTAGGGSLTQPGEIAIDAAGNWTYLSAGSPVPGQPVVTEGYKIDNNFDFVGSVAPIINGTLGQRQSLAFINGLGATQFNVVPGVNNAAKGVNVSGLVVGNVGATPYTAVAPFTNANFAVLNALPQGYTISDMNNAGTIVGTFGAEGGAGTGFMLKNGVLTNIMYPGSYGTWVNGISNDGVIVGTWFDSNHDYQGFTDNAGVFTDISLPGDPQLFLEGINISGQIVGDYFKQNAQGNTIDVGVLLDPTATSLIDQPSYVGDLPVRIGIVPPLDLVQLQSFHLVDTAFQDVPEPSGLALAAIWLSGLVLSRRRAIAA